MAHLADHCTLLRGVIFHLLVAREVVFLLPAVVFLL